MRRIAWIFAAALLFSLSAFSATNTDSHGEPAMPPPPPPPREAAMVPAPAPPEAALLRPATQESIPPGVTQRFAARGGMVLALLDRILAQLEKGSDATGKGFALPKEILVIGDDSLARFAPPTPDFPAHLKKTRDDLALAIGSLPRSSETELNALAVELDLIEAVGLYTEFQATELGEAVKMGSPIDQGQLEDARLRALKTLVPKFKELSETQWIIKGDSRGKFENTATHATISEIDPTLGKLQLRRRLTDPLAFSRDEKKKFKYFSQEDIPYILLAAEFQSAVSVAQKK